MANVLFVLKKLVSRLLFPAPVIAIVLLVGVLLLWFSKRRQKLGKILVSVSLVLFLLGTNGTVVAYICAPLDRMYDAYGVTDNPVPVDYVVVLGGGHSDDETLSPMGKLATETAVRVAEGIRVYLMNPGSKLVLAGGTVWEPTPEAVNMQAMAIALGVPEEDIILETESRDTDDQARLIGAIVGDSPFALVTSGLHMVRSMKLFEAQGLDPIPAPTAQRVKGGGGFDPTGLYPDASKLADLRIAVYEYIGLAWGWVRGLY